MCDYSLEALATREAQIGDKLVIGIVHGFMLEDAAAKLAATRAARDACMTCLKDGTVVNLTMNGTTFNGVRFMQINTGGYRDHLEINGLPYAIASMARGVTAEVVSIPGIKPVEKTLDEKLGLDTINAEVTQAAEPSAVAAAYRRVVAAVTGTPAKVD